MIGKKFGKLTIIKDSGKRTNDKGVIYLCKCDCGNEKEVSRKLLMNEKKPRSCGCSRKERSILIFESNYEKSNGCWEWKGCLNHKGYGKIGTNETAHRRAFFYAYGEIPKGMCVCHICDNPKCVNPKHLFLGTYLDNTKDKIYKNRHAKGSKTGTSKLNEESVLEIRKMRLSGKDYEELSEIFGVCWGTIAIICKNRNWKHVPLGEECRKMPQIRRNARGSNCGNTKLDENKVLQIKTMIKNGNKSKDIASFFNVSLWTISHIKRGNSWKHVE